MKYKKESPTSLGKGNTFNRHYEDTTNPSQLQTIFQYLSEHVATTSMVSAVTGISKSCITRYKRDLEKVGLLWEIEKNYCQETGYKAWYLTTNPALSSKVPKQMLTIEEQYNHLLWQHKCQEIIQRDDCCCRCCGVFVTQLQVYPLYDNPNGYLWEIDDEALVTVCDPCQKILHNELPKLSGIIGFRILTGEIDLNNLNQQL